MATPSKYRKSESKSVDFNRRAEELQCEIEMLETTLGPFVALYAQTRTNDADPRFNTGTQIPN